MRKRMKARGEDGEGQAPVEPRRWSGIPLVALTHLPCRHPVSGEGYRDDKVLRGDKG